MEILQATMADFDGILALLQANHVDHIPEEEKKNGFVTTHFTREQMETLIVREKGVIIAKENGIVYAFATAAPWAFWATWPLFAHMITELPKFTFEGQTLTVQNSYQYGPVCVHKDFRGTGLFEQVFYASLASMEARFPIMATFINQINPHSYKAHTGKVPMTTAGTFQFNGNNYYLMACSTSLQPKK